MKNREDVLTGALEKNEDESQRWQMYLKENEIAMDNMTTFAKRLTVDVMVPVGKKAFMSGHLLHTNEVLVGHYQGYFSKCTTSKAKEICEMRIKMAKQYVQKLEMEADMWQNKLYKPYVEGVLPSSEEHEIKEDFNEETEKLWKEKHRISVKKFKTREREEREKHQKQNFNETNSCDEQKNEKIFKMLEEAEILEELEQELDTLQLDDVNDETIRKLLSGEINLPQEKSRVAHHKNTTVQNTIEVNTLSTNIIKINDIDNITQMNTNNNVLPNQDIINRVNLQESDLEEEILPEEVVLIKEQAKYLNTEDQIGFYDYQIQIIRQKLQLLPLRTQVEINEKIHLINILEYLEELLEEAEETVAETELCDKDENEKIDEIQEIARENAQNLDTENKEIVSSESHNSKSKQKRRISFALQDQTLEFRNHEAVTQMLPLKIEKPKRDIINIEDNNDEQKDKYKLNSENVLTKRDLIQAKVEKSLQFMEENQSNQDFDLVKKIIQSSNGNINTLHIKFKHSQKEGYINKDTSNTVCSPADFYNLYAETQKSLKNCNKPSTVFINSYEGEDQVKVPVLKESDRKIAFANPKSEFSNPLQAKSILKNKYVMEKERNTKVDNNNKVKKTKIKPVKKDEDDNLSAYYKVMNDVVERPLTEPEPLPNSKFIDVHTPKKRISRFKQTRQGNDKTQ